MPALDARADARTVGALLQSPEGDPGTARSTSVPLAPSPWQEALGRLARAAERLGLDDGMLEMFSHPRRVLEVAIPIRRDDGQRAVFTGYRVQHSTSRGPGKGGLRFHAEVGLEEIKALAMTMTWKAALVGIPYGGAKGGIRLDPHSLSIGERERVTRRYTSEIMPFIGPGKDVLAPDLGTSEREMAWVMDTYTTALGVSEATSVTGKPVVVGGSQQRRGATGAGIVMVLRRAAKELGMTPPIRIALHGYGNVGRTVGELLAGDPDFTVVGIADLSGARYEPRGLALADVASELDAGGCIDDLPGDSMPPQALLEVDCDVLVPASVGSVIDDNAERIQAPLVVEGANGPTTPVAEGVLAQRGITVVPDIVANAGGVIVSHFEFLQSIDPLSADEATTRLEQRIGRTFDQTWAYASRKDLTLPRAAMCLAVAAVADAHRTRGLYP